MSNGNRCDGTAHLGYWGYTLALFLSCLIIAGLAYSQGRESERRYEAPREHAESAKAYAQRACVGLEPAAAFECINDAVETGSETARAEQDLDAQQWMAFWALLMVIVSTIMAVVTGIGIYYVKRTLDATLTAVAETSKATDAMWEANEIAERNARRGMRPYLWPEAAWIEIVDDESLIAHVHVRNFGQTPAINTRAWIHSWIADFPLKDALPEPKDGEVEMGSEVIGQGRHSEYRQPHRRIPPPLVQDIKEGHRALYVYGHGTYLDTFGREHFFRYIYFSNGEAFERKRFSPYSSGNVIDIG